MQIKHNIIALIAVASMPTAYAGGDSAYGGITEYDAYWKQRTISDGINDRKSFPYVGGNIGITTDAERNLDDGQNWKYEITDQTLAARF